MKRFNFITLNTPWLKSLPWPNILTCLRVIFLLPLIYLIMRNHWLWHFVALFFFIALAASDYLDGFLARKWGKQSQLGALLDPIADKVFVLSLFVVLIAKMHITGFTILGVLLILFREISVSGLREFMASIPKTLSPSPTDKTIITEKIIVLPVSQLAKWKTTMQMVSIGFFIVYPYLAEFLQILALWIFWLTVLLTLYTGSQYAIQAYREFKQETADPENENII